MNNQTQTPPKRQWKKGCNHDIAYDFIKSKGFKTVTKAVVTLGREAYRREFREFKERN